jgi:hypothetical protein
MLVYFLTVVAALALIATAFVQKISRQRGRRCVACAPLRSFCETCLVAGLIFSIMQMTFALADHHQASSRTIGQLQTELGRYRAVGEFLALKRIHELLLWALFLALVLWPFTQSTRPLSIVRTHPSFATTGYVLVTLVTCLMLLGSMTARNAFAPHVAALEQQVERIEERYGEVLEQASRRLDRGLTLAAVDALKQDEQWTMIRGIWLDLSQKLDELPKAFPDLFVAAAQRVNTSEEALPALLPVPNHVQPVMQADPVPAAVGTQRAPSMLLFAQRFGGSLSQPQPQASFEIPVSLRWEFFDEAINSTYASWSQDNAQRLLEELAHDDDEAASDGIHYVIEALARRVAGVLYQPASEHAGAIGPQHEWHALPSQFLKAFLAATLNEEARFHLETAANRELADWLLGQKDWQQTQGGYLSEARPELIKRSADAHQVAQRAYQSAIRQAAAEYALARSRLSLELRNYADGVFEQRWHALEANWSAGCEGLSPAAKESSARVLSRIGRKLRMDTDPIARIALLGKIEDAWRDVPAGAESAWPAGLEAVAPALIVSESVVLGSHEFARENETELHKLILASLRQRFQDSIGRPAKLSETYKLQAEVGAIVADANRLAAAAAGRLLEHNGTARYAGRWFAGWQACTIEGAITTMTYDAQLPAPSVTIITLPCW